jgi:uncharacterized membrane protein YbjE (DUF340 family)
MAAMDNKNKTVSKFRALYMSLGLCLGVGLGVSGGLLFGSMVFPDNIALGMCMGVCIGCAVGMCLGMAVGAEKDKRLSEKMMIIRKIEAVTDSSDSVIYANDKDGAEKQYTVSAKKMKEEKFAEGDRVAEDDNGLVSLESR